MGLIRAIAGAAGGVLADQWKEFFYCEAIDKNVMVTKGVKRTKGNNNGNDNIISNGSGIAVADGQCMIIVEQGKIVEVCAEPGEFTYDTSTEPSIFAGSLGQSIKDSFKTIGKRFAYGGDTGKDQRRALQLHGSARIREPDQGLHIRGYHRLPKSGRESYNDDG